MTLKRNKHFTLIFFLTIVLVGCGTTYQKSQTVTDILETDHQGVKALYFYPSTMRMLTGIVGTENMEGLDGIKEARLLFQWNDVNSNFQKQVSQIKRGIFSESFETLFQMNSKGADIQIFIRDSDTPVYIIFYSDTEYNFVLEAIGELSPEAIRSLATTDMSGFLDLLNVNSEGSPIEDENANYQEEQQNE
ncbi:MAG TPA: DUF4252 domain-containing protein [Cryomorphaceae bacterium]|nr:DUF4252 domain-containing protein [Cryomorphaceae bacterium]